LSSWDDASRYELARLFAAMMLAPQVEVCEALLWGESVPLDRLSSWVSRFAEREGLGERVYLSDFDSTPSTRPARRLTA
jgi:hypothetical protein